MDDLPCFSWIDDLLVVEQEPLTVVVEYFTEGIIRHFHSYANKQLGRRRIMHLNKLPEPRPMNCHSGADGNIHIALRSFVMPTVCK